MGMVKELFLTSALVCAMAGCWRDGAAHPPDAAGRASAVAAAPAGCNTLDQLGEAVAGGTSTSPVPPMTGGLIVDGTYVLMSNLAYERRTADKKTYRRTVRYTGGTLEVVDSRDGAADVHTTHTVTTSRNQLVDTTTCPPGVAGATLAYTATSTAFFVAEGGDDRLVQTYVRQ